MFCTNCGAKIEGSLLFCTNCGAKLAGSAPANAEGEGYRANGMETVRSGLQEPRFSEAGESRGAAGFENAGRTYDNTQPYVDPATAQSMSYFEPLPISEEDSGSVSFTDTQNVSAAFTAAEQAASEQAAMMSFEAVNSENVTNQAYGQPGTTEYYNPAPAPVRSENHNRLPVNQVPYGQQTYQQPQMQQNMAVRQAAPYEGDGRAPTGKKPSKVIPIVILVSIFLLLAAAAVWFFFFRDTREKFPVEEYVSAEFKGDNGKGKAGVFFDYNGFTENLLKQMGHEGSELQEDEKAVKEYITGIGAYISKSDNLSNGDKVTVSIEMPEDASGRINFNFTDTQKEITVSGLGGEAPETGTGESGGQPETSATETESVAAGLTPFDPFEGLRVKFTGISPNLHLQIEVANAEPYSFLRFATEKADGIKIGDQIVIKATFDEAQLTAAGYAPTVTEKTYTAEGNVSYIENAAQLKDGDIVSLGAEYVSKIAGTVSGSGSGVKLEDASNIGYVFAYNRSPKAGDSVFNRLYLLYNCYVTSDDGPVVFYHWFTLENITVGDDGANAINPEAVEEVKYPTVKTATGKHEFGGFTDSEAFLDQVSNECPGWETSNRIADIQPRQLPVTPVTKEAGHLTTDPNGYILPDADRQVYTEEFLSTMSDEELRYARNELCARHGRQFATPEIASYFAGKNWYSPSVTAREFDENTDRYLNESELANMKLINKIEADREAGRATQAETTAAH